MSKLRQFFDSTPGKIFGGLVVVGGLLAAVWALRSSLGDPNVDAANNRFFVDAETGKPFPYELKLGDEVPVLAPSGNKTGYPAEACFWTKEGQPKTTPTYVILNESLGKSGPTFCPDCNRLVVGYNPTPGPDTKVPPTQAEFKPRNTGDR